MKLDVVVPVYNERSNLATLLKQVSKVTASVKFLQVCTTFIIVDDGSSDNSWQEIQILSNTYSVRGVKLSRNFGKEAAVEAGLKVSKADAVVVMDSDLQHPPALIPEMVEKWQNLNAKIVSAVKVKRQRENFIKRIFSHSFYKLFKLFTGLDLASESDFKLLDRCVVDSYIQLKEKNKFFRGLTRWLGYQEAVITFVPVDRFDGSDSRWSTVSLLKYAVTSMVSFSWLPLQIVSWLGILNLAISTVLGIHTVYKKLIGNSIEGFTTVILSVLFIGSVLMISLGIIGIYLSKIYDEVKRRPNFIVSESIESEYDINHDKFEVDDHENFSDSLARSLNI